MKLKTEIQLDAPAAYAWQVLGEEFGEVAEWSASLCTSTLRGELGVGAVRSCEGLGFGPFPAGEVTEELTQFDRETMAFAYEGTSGLPWFITHAKNAWSIEDLGRNRCRVISRAEVQMVWWLKPLGPLMPWLLRRDMRRLSEELKHRIEQGNPHPRSLAAATG